MMDEMGEKEVDGYLGIGFKPFSVASAMEGVFSIAKARGLISRYIIDKRTN